MRMQSFLPMFFAIFDRQNPVRGLSTRFGVTSGNRFRLTVRLFARENTEKKSEFPKSDFSSDFLGFTGRIFPAERCRFTGRISSTE